MSKSDKIVNIIGAGLSGLSCALSLAGSGIKSNLISAQASERSQSVLAEGGINAALDTMGENDSPVYHMEETLRAGGYLESESVVRGLAENAPKIVAELAALGVPFNIHDGKITLRHFGGQANKRTAYAKSSTGKMLMTALIDEIRKYEASGVIIRYPHHEVVDMEISDGRFLSFTAADTYSGRLIKFSGDTVMCTGGLNGMFEGMTTGTTQNTGNAAAIAFARGVGFSNLEFIQYHPTTAKISAKRMLISEAARGEGGRLYIMRDGKPWYFMEEKYPELGNLMPRDVVSREMTIASNRDDCEGSVYLDLSGLSEDIWENMLPDLREEIIDYLKIDPAREAVPVSPGIHYFMGGIRVDSGHRTEIEGLYAAGEAASRYHGANRLGGNSTLGAIYGGKLAAKSIIEGGSAAKSTTADGAKAVSTEKTGNSSEKMGISADDVLRSDPKLREELTRALASGLGIIRTEDGMQEALKKVREMQKRNAISQIDSCRLRLGEAMLLSAIERKESRGSHSRSDYPDADDKYKKFSVARFDGKQINIDFEDAGAGGAGI